MIIELNKVLPPEKRIPLIEFRGRLSEIRDLHREWFPTSGLRATSFALIAASTALFAIAVIIEVAK
jgi:hypothetical protein